MAEEKTVEKLDPKKGLARVQKIYIALRKRYGELFDSEQIVCP
jgi:hypothetical protein